MFRHELLFIADLVRMTIDLYMGYMLTYLGYWKTIQLIPVILLVLFVGDIHLHLTQYRPIQTIMALFKRLIKIRTSVIAQITNNRYSKYLFIRPVRSLMLWFVSIVTEHMFTVMLQEEDNIMTIMRSMPFTSPYTQLFTLSRHQLYDRLVDALDGRPLILTVEQNEAGQIVRLNQIEANDAEQIMRLDPTDPAHIQTEINAGMDSLLSYPIEPQSSSDETVVHHRVSTDVADTYQ